MTPNPQAVEAIGRLSDAMTNSPQDKRTIQQILTEIRTDYPEVYRQELAVETSIVHEAENHLRDLRDDIEGIVVPGFILGHPEARANMERFGAIRDGVFIPENEEVKRDFEEYKDLMGFIENTPRNQTQSIIDMEGLVSRYEKLLAPTNSRFIRGADYLTAMYGEALYEDIIARGFIHKRDGDRREYEIVCPEIVNGVYTEKDLADAFPNHPYLRLLKRIEVNDMMDMMAVGSIMVKDRISYRGMDLVGQDDLIKTILAKHNIKGPDGRDILNPQLLLVHWETPVATGPLTGKTIKQQILDERFKLVENKDDGGSWQAYQELQYILDFMENEDYLDTDRSLKTFQFANQYRIAFLGRQAYIDAGGPEAGEITEKNIFDHLGDFAKGNTLAGLGVALIAWLTGHKKTALFASIFALMGGKLADAGSDLLNEGKGYVNSWTKEQLGILDPQDVRYNIKTPAGIEEADVQGQLDALFAANEGARDNGGVDNNVLNGTLSNAKIAKIYQSILGNDALLRQSYATDSTTIATIRSAIGVPPRVTAGDFDSIVPASELGPISDADILAAITLMGNTIKEDGDTSFGDIVFSGIDPLKQPYTPIEYGFYGESSEEFESMLNTLLANARSGATTRVEVGKIEEVKSTLASIFVGEGLGDLGEITQRVQSTLLLTEASEASEAIQTIGLIPDADLNIGGVDYKAQIIDTLTKYRGYSEVDEFLSPYDGKWAQAEDSAEAVHNRLELFAERRLGISLTNIDEADNAIEAIDEDLLLFANPAAIKVAQGTRTVDISTDPAYAPLLERFNDIKAELEQERREYETLKTNIVNGTIAGIGGNPNILTPAEQTEYQNDFNNADLRELEVLADEITALTDTIKQGNVNSPSNLTRYIGTYGSALARLQGIQSSISGVTLQAAGTNEHRLQQAILSSINDAISIEGATLETTISDELTDAFQSLKDVQDRLATITITGTSSISDLETNMAILTSISSSLDSLVDGTFDGASNNITDAEKALAEAERVLGRAPTIANSNITGRSLFETSQDKIEDITEQVRIKATSSTVTLDDLFELYDSGLVEAAHDANPRLGLREEVKRSIETKIEAHIRSLGTVEAILDYTEGDYEKHRRVFRWSYEGLTGNLPSDEQLTEKLKTTLESEITSLTNDVAGLAKAKELARRMEWHPSESMLGRWKDVISENFTDFTGLFPESDIKQKFDDKLEDIRNQLMTSNLVTSLSPRSVISIPIDNALSNEANRLRSLRDTTSTNRADTIELDRDSQSLQYLYDTYGNVSGIATAYKNEYLID